jgi:metal-responsive CopG/Arc/MetJ family transcriptional regulator
VAKTPKAAPPDTDREHVTLPNFILHQLDRMVGPYAGTRPEVIKWIIQTWLHENRDKVAQQVEEYRKYRAETRSGEVE